MGKGRGRKVFRSEGTYPIFDIPFIGVASDEPVHLQFLIQILLRIQLLFLGEPATRHMTARNIYDREKGGGFRDSRGFSKSGEGKGDAKEMRNAYRAQNGKTI